MTKTDTIKKAMIEALEKTLGIVTNACKMAGISRETHYRWLKEDDKYKEAVDGISDIALDFAESQLHLQIMNGEVSSTIFYLKTKGKRRGYIERQEVAHEGDVVKQITVNVLKASHVEELSNGVQQLDGDENAAIEDSGFVVPATEAANIQDIPLYEFDKEVELPNEMDIYEE